MKKLICLITLLLCFLFTVSVVKAEEIENKEPTEEITEVETVETTEVDDTTEVEPTDQEINDEVEKIKEDAENKLKAWMDEKFNNANLTSWVLTIFNALTSTAFLTALLGVVVKYSKYKGKNTDVIIDEVKAQVGEYLKERFDNLSEVEIKKLIQALDDLKESNEVMMKVLVLAQDKTSQGKVALLDYLGSKTESKEVKEQAEQVKGKLENEEKEKQEAVEKIKEYKEIF